MAKTKAGGKTNQKTNRQGRRLGVKVYGGEKITTGSIILRQRGSQYFPGSGVKLSKDFTIFALKDGAVNFKKLNGKTIVSVI